MASAQARVRGWLMASALALVACGSSEPDDPAPDDGLVTELDPTELATDEGWSPCGFGIECRELEVPIDHSNPAGAKLSLALARAPHWEGYDDRGVILVNPGGPGGEGRPFLELVDARRALGILRGFDLVSFDPRGVGESGAVACGTGTVPKVVFDSRGTAGLIEYFEADATACAERMGPLFDHVGSQDVVRDMDLIRQALGQRQLNFLGASYGTRLAALYAETFPERVRAFVLDGPVHPEADLARLVTDQFEALVAAVDEFFIDCSQGVLDCPLDAEFLALELWNQSAEQGAEDLFAGLWKSNLSQIGGREGLADFLYTYAVFPDLWEDLILDVFDDPSPQEVAVNQAVHCTDQSVSVPTASEIEAAIARFDELSPQFAVTTLPFATCTGWHVTPNPVPRLTAPDSPPLLLIAGEHDILTPARVGAAMRASLANAVLVSSAHYGHGAILAGSPCIDALLDDYFTRLALPEDGTRCP
jgi:pimeloyl-ACP methyl ester carboxylesterase